MKFCAFVERERERSEHIPCKRKLLSERKRNKSLKSQLILPKIDCARIMRITLEKVCANRRFVESKEEHERS